MLARFHDVAVIDDSDTSPPRFAVQWTAGDDTPRRTVFRVERRRETPGLGYQIEAEREDGDDLGDLAHDGEALACEAADAWHDGGPAFRRLLERVRRGNFDVVLDDPDAPVASQPLSLGEDGGQPTDRTTVY